MCEESGAQHLQGLWGCAPPPLCELTMLGQRRQTTPAHPMFLPEPTTLRCKRKPEVPTCQFSLPERALVDSDYHCLQPLCLSACLQLQFAVSHVHADSGLLDLCFRALFIF